MIYLAALLAELGGVEPIIGAFFAGLALNRLIPHTSALMNRVEFVGNAIFIPFFLISVGMIIDFSVFLKDMKTVEIALLMTVIGIASKYFAAVATQKTFKLTKINIKKKKKIEKKKDNYPEYKAFIPSFFEI